MNKAHFLIAADLTETRQAITVNTGKPQFYSAVEGTFPNPSYRRTFLSRYDQQLTGKQNLFVRWAWEWDHTNCETCGATSAAFSGSRIDQRRHSLVGGHTMVLGSRMLNEFRAQYAPFSFLTSPPGTDVPTDPTSSLARTLLGADGGVSVPESDVGIRQQPCAKGMVEGVPRRLSDRCRESNVKFGAADVRGPNKDDSASNITHGTWTFSTDQLLRPGRSRVDRGAAAARRLSRPRPPTSSANEEHWISTTYRMSGDRSGI